MSTSSGLRRVLLVEDHALLRTASARALARTFAITAVDCADEALRAARPGAFDAVLTDFRIPDMTGLELLALLRWRDPELRRVLASAVEVPGLTGHLAGGLVHAFLPKPFDLPAARRALTGQPD